VQASRIVIDAVLARLDARPNGSDRWRCACPVCGGSNRSTLSIGIGDTGAVLLKCWKSGCDPERIAQAIGLGIEDLFPPRDEHAAPAKRRRMITAPQALDVLADDALLVWTAATNVANGTALAMVDINGLTAAARRIDAIRHEAHS
jgi:hypothetical protein